ncbi:MAG: alginate export family protein, partial [Myxococcota bacterium]|nr:alginate export family protein [Myxococcota bacterium]
AGVGPRADDGGTDAPAADAGVVAGDSGPETGPEIARRAPIERDAREIDDGRSDAQDEEAADDDDDLQEGADGDPDGLEELDDVEELEELEDYEDDDDFEDFEDDEDRDEEAAGEGDDQEETEDVAPTPADPPLTFRAGELLLRFSGEVRARAELRARWFDAPVDRFLVTTRVRLGLEVRWDALRVVVQLQDARDMGVSPGASSGATTGFFQGFFEIGHGSSFLRLGRQTIDVGTGRLIGSLNWQSAARSFDALRARGAIGPLAFDVFAAVVSMPRLVVDERYEIDSEGDYVGGLTIEWVDPALRLGMDVLYRHDGPAETNLDRRRDVVAFTLRADGTLAPVHYVFEVITQAGGQREGPGMIAFAAIGEVYVRLAEPWSPELGIGLTYGSGKSPSGGVSELDNFYPSNHLVYGLADLFGLRNQAQAFVYGSLTPQLGALTMWAAARVFALPEPTARWTNAPGQVVGVDPANQEGLAGGEIDAELRWRPLDGVDLWAGYALFLPGPGGAALGRTEPMHFAYLMLGASLP